MSHTRDNLKAGIFVLLGIVLALVVVFLLVDVDRLFEQQQTVRVVYQLGDGVGGLKPGAEVKLGDQPVGTVTEIQDVIEDGRVVAKRVVFAIPDRYRIYQNASIELQQPFIGSGAALNIVSVGEGPVYDPATDIEGGLMPSALASQFAKDLGIEAQQRQEIKQIIHNVKELSDTLNQDVAVIMKEAKPMMEDARVAVADAKVALADARELVGKFNQRSELWMDRLDSISKSADEGLATANTLIQDKDPTIRSALDNVEAITKRAREQTMDQIKGALEKADEALANARDATAEFKTLIHANGPVLERTLANFQLTAGQLKLAAIEVRRSPWRLLYQPSDQEIAHDNLYDAARSFALAASAIDAATAGLDALVHKEPDNREAIQQRLEYLETLYQKFEEAEKRFWAELDAGGQ